MQIPFETSIPGMFGLSLDLQIIDQDSYSLVRRGADIISSLDHASRASRRIRTGARQDFLELFSSEHEHPVGLLAQMTEIKAQAMIAAHANQTFLSGGGAHAGAFWIRAGQDTVAGHVTHDAGSASFYASRVFVGVKSGDQAVRLIHLLTPYVPHLIALSASSPLMAGQTPGMACARLLSKLESGVATSLPSGIQTWREFEDYAHRLSESKPPHSTDYGWDIVPRPELGAIEVRVLDASLSMERACAIAGFIQTLAEWALRQESLPGTSPTVQSVNRAQACCFGLNADYLRFDAGIRVPLRQELLALLDEVMPVADELGSLDQIDEVASWVQAGHCDSDWLRQQVMLGLGSEAMAQRMVRRFDVGQGDAEVSGTSVGSVPASQPGTFPAKRMKTDQRFRTVVPNRLSPGMSVAHFNRQA